MRRSLRRRWFTSLSVAVLGIVPALTFLPSLTNSSVAAGAVVADGREVGFSFDGDLLAVPAAQRNADFDRIKAMGGTWVRVPFNWSTLEMHGKGNYNWSPADAIVAAANARGLKIDAVVSYAPGWARPAGSAPTAPPTRVADYGDFLAAAAAHFAPMGVHTWEIWNEPNLFTMWSPKPDVVKYTSLLKVAYPRIKAADATATVITGGMSPAYDAPDGSQVLPLTWVKGIYANGGKAYFDAIGHHPSSFPYSSNTIADWNSFQQSKTLYSYMSAQGDTAKKIWATEIGFPTGTSNRAVDEKTQGDRFAESLEAWAKFSFHGPMFMYSVRNNGTNIADHYQNFGVYTIDGVAKLSVPRITQALRAPQHVNATPGTGTATVTWDAPGYDYGSPITGYTITTSPGGATTSVAASARRVTVNVAAGSTYTFTVRPDFSGIPGVTSVASNKVTPSVPSLVPVGSQAIEGNTGTRTLNVLVVLSKPSDKTVSAHYTTATIAPFFNASAPQDYTPTTGTVTFAPGETQKYVPVTIVGDTVKEVGDDQFLLVLSDPTNANLGGFGGVASARIVDDD